MDHAAVARPLLDSRVAAFLVFSLGFAASMAAGLLAADSDYARAKYTIWPCAALGGWAVALMLRHGFGRELDATPWRIWWAWGLLAYAVHLWWGFGAIYAWDTASVYAGQGAVVATANFALFFLWAFSVIGASARWPLWWLHAATAVLFGVAMLAASILFGRDISPVGGGILLAVWLAALYLRQPEEE